MFQSIVIEIDGDEEITFNRYDSATLSDLTREQVETNLVNSGMWTALRTRPYSRTPHLGTTPAAIFVSAMDTNPLAADPMVIIEQNEKAFNDGLIILTRLTEGKVYVCHGEKSPAKLNDGQISYNQFVVLTQLGWSVRISIS